MKYQFLFSLKNNEKVFINAVVIGTLRVNTGWAIFEGLALVSVCVQP